jgi:hypothetical protein
MQVFSPSFRHKLGTPRGYFFKPAKRDLPDVEAVGIAVAIVAGLLTAIITLFALVLIIVNWFKS